jgi:hypothetical protein
MSRKVGKLTSLADRSRATSSRILKLICLLTLEPLIHVALRQFCTNLTSTWTIPE